MVLIKVRKPVYFIDYSENIKIQGNAEVIESNSLALTCSASANPGPISYKWTTPSGGSSNDPGLNIPKTTLGDIGNYRCEASSEITYCGVTTAGSIAKIQAVRILCEFWM